MKTTWIEILKEAGADQLLALLNDGETNAYLDGTATCLEENFKLPARKATPDTNADNGPWMEALTEAGLDQLFDYIKDGGTVGYMKGVCFYLAETFDAPQRKVSLEFTGKMTLFSDLIDIKTPIDGFEMQPVRYTDETKSYIEVCEEEDADFWSVYLHIPDNGVECIADCDSKKAASDLMLMLEKIGKVFYTGALKDVLKKLPQREAMVKEVMKASAIKY